MAKHLPSHGTLFLSPEGQFNLIPFEALADGSGKYLTERYTFNYVASGRDLVKFGQPKRESKPPVLVANPAFDLSARERIAQAKESGKPTLLAQALRASRHSTAQRGMDLESLAGAVAEVKSIAALLRDSLPAVYTGPEALEENVKRLQSPRIAHFATHGFFLQDQDLLAATEKQRFGEHLGGWERVSLAGIENPLLRSGLALAGANRFGKEELKDADDGLLTALEISGMDLTGTDLVVLSACDTGLGEVKCGQGVFGLRRAFLHAGARTVIMSLCKVPDKETKGLMVEFYRRWLKTGNKVRALQESQLSILKQRRVRYGAAHPLFWGAFIAMGDPR